MGSKGERKRNSSKRSTVDENWSPGGQRTEAGRPACTGEDKGGPDNTIRWVEQRERRQTGNEQKGTNQGVKLRTVT